MAYVPARSLSMLASTAACFASRRRSSCCVAAGGLAVGGRDDDAVVSEERATSTDPPTVRTPTSAATQAVRRPDLRVAAACMFAPTIDACAANCAPASGTAATESGLRRDCFRRLDLRDIHRLSTP